MGYHHVAIATRDLDATHRFYTDAMGFELVRVEAAPTDEPDGWAKHLFYETGGNGMFAVWDLHDPRVADFDPGISTGLGLPVWVNHVAFKADEARQQAVKARMDAEGIEPLMEVDHGWCQSLYYVDPNGIMVEFCRDTPGIEPDHDGARALFTATERNAAEKTITAAAGVTP